MSGQWYGKPQKQNSKPSIKSSKKQPKPFTAIIHSLPRSVLDLSISRLLTAIGRLLSRSHLRPFGVEVFQAHSNVSDLEENSSQIDLTESLPPFESVDRTLVSIFFSHSAGYLVSNGAHRRGTAVLNHVSGFTRAEILTWNNHE